MRRYNSYRFRLVSISCDPSFLFSIDSHQMTVIEVDGKNVQPLLVDSLEIYAGAHDAKPAICSIIVINAQTGQRYSVVVRRPCLFTLGVPHASVGRCDPASWQLLYVFYLLSVAQIKRKQGFVHYFRLTLRLVLLISATPTTLPFSVMKGPSIKIRRRTPQ